MPFENNTIIGLSNPDYVTVVKDSIAFYGGCQMWFDQNNWYSKDYILHNYGCGTIAAADLFLYLALQREDMQSLLTSSVLRGLDQISYESYLPYVRKIHDSFTKTVRFLAVLGPKAAAAINSYSDSFDLGLEAAWKWKLTYYDMLDLIEEMLRKDIPVILSIGPNTPNMWGKKGIPFYERKEIEYQEESADGSPRKKPYYYQMKQTSVNRHYVTVTGIVKDDITAKIMLRISSWGKLYYINYEEYRDYVDTVGGSFTSSMVYVKERK